MIYTALTNVPLRCLAAMVLASLIEVFIEQPFHDVGGRVRMPDAKGVRRSRASRPVAKDSCVHAHCVLR